MDSGESQADQAEEINGAMRDMVLQVSTRFDQMYEYDISVSQVNSSNGKPDYVLVGGYTADVFWYLQSLLGFRYVLRSDINPAKFDKESVEKASIDIYVASYSLIPDRIKYLEPTFVIGASRIFAFMDHAFEADSAHQNIFIAPFTTRLWACVIILLVTFTLSLLVFNYFDDDSDMGMGDMAFYSLSMSLQRGSDNPLLRNSTRMASTILSFSVVIIMASYSGIMTSIFAVSVYNINSIEALVHSNYRILLEYGFVTNESTINYMLQQLVHIPNVAELLRKAERSNFVFLSFVDAIKEVKKLPSTYIIDEETALDTISKEWDGFPCTWGKISVFNLRYPWVMYMKKQASFHRAFNSGIVRIKERGILNRIRKKWIRQPPSFCASGSDEPPKSITFTQVRNAFTAFFTMLLFVCPTILLLEKCFSLCSQYFKRKSKISSVNSANTVNDWYIYYR